MLESQTLHFVVNLKRSLKSRSGIMIGLQFPGRYGKPTTNENGMFVKKISMELSIRFVLLSCSDLFDELLFNAGLRFDSF